MQQLKIGSTLQGGKYKIEKVLGQGGFGITYLASQDLMERKVAIKEFFFKEYCERDESTSHVTLGTQSNREFVERFMTKFLKEARIISEMRHPNIIQIFDVFKENNTAYYAMEYIEGESLNEIVRRQGFIPETEALAYIEEVASALDYIHQRRINHLDVKPANILIRRDNNQVVLIDFGLAKQYDAGGRQTSSTPVGISHGYAPIEQYKQDGMHEFTPQSDIYALGATFYKLLTGVIPPQPSDILNDGLPDLPNTVSPCVRNAIYKATEIRKKDRPTSMMEFLTLLMLENKKVVAEEYEITELIPQESNITSDSAFKEKITPVSAKKGIFIHRYLIYTLIGIIVITSLGLIFHNSQSNNDTGQIMTLEERPLSEFEKLLCNDSLEMTQEENDSLDIYLEMEETFEDLRNQTQSAKVITDNKVSEETNKEKRLSEFELLENEAKAGDAKAQYKLSLVYENGNGIKKDLDKAFEWCEKSAIQGYAKAQFHLFMYHDMNEEQQVEWLKKSAAQGYTDAEYFLAFHYFIEDIEPEKCFELFKRAAIKGKKEAQYYLGNYFYKEGRYPASKDLEEAKKWLKKAAEKGHKRAKYTLDTWDGSIKLFDVRNY